MNILEKTLEKTIKAVGEDTPRVKLKECERCGHWYNPKGQSGINHKLFCKGE
jgi:hypothetical protein